MGVDRMLNDVTVQAYDVQLESGPSYETKREEARDGMLTFLQQAPSAAPVVLDLIANAQDWPNADKFADRLKTLLPPNIQALEAQESGEQPPPPPPPSPEALIEQQKIQVEHGKLQVDQYKANADLKKAEMSLQEKQMELKAKGIEAFGQNDAQALVSQAVNTLAGIAHALGAVVDQLNAPKRLVRDVNGRAVGVETITKH
jgi:hypothetical protein